MSNIPNKLRQLLELNERRRASFQTPTKPKISSTSSQLTSTWSGMNRPTAKPLKIRKNPNYGVTKKKLNRSVTPAQRPPCEIVQLDKQGYIENPNGPLLQTLINGKDQPPNSELGLVRARSPFTNEEFHIFSFQREAVELFRQRLRKMRWIVNGAEMGLGKTIMSILLYATYCVRAASKIPTTLPLTPMDRTGGWKMLVVAPKAVLSNWYKTFLERTWLESHNIILEEKSDRLHQSVSKAMQDDSQIAVVLVAYDLIRLMHADAYEEIPDPDKKKSKIWRRKANKPLPMLFQWVKRHNDHLVVSFDESHHRLRNHGSKTCIAHETMMKLAPNSKGILTSGTAFCNRPSDLMSQMRAIGDTSDYIETEAWYPEKRDHKVVSTDAINYWREHMICIPSTVLTLPKMHQCLIEPNVGQDSSIPWNAYQSLVDDARGAAVYSASDNEAQRREKSVLLISSLRKLDLMIIHPHLVRYDAKTIRNKENTHLIDEMLSTPTVYVKSVFEVVLRAFYNQERSMIITSESVTVLHVLERFITNYLSRQDITTKNYFYEGNLDMAARMKMEYAFCEAANQPVESNPTTMHICYLSMHAGANGITILGPWTMLKLPPGGFNPTIGKQVDKRFHRIGVKHEVQVVTLRAHGSAAHAISTVNDDKKYLSELTTNLNNLAVDDDNDSFGCTPLDSTIADNISWKVKGTYAQNLWNYDINTRRLIPPVTPTEVN
jgi:hypothetical protein